MIKPNKVISAFKAIPDKGTKTALLLTTPIKYISLSRFLLHTASYTDPAGRCTRMPALLPNSFSVRGHICFFGQVCTATLRRLALQNFCKVTDFYTSSAFVPRHSTSPASLCLDGKNRAMLRSTPASELPAFKTILLFGLHSLRNAYALYWRAVSGHSLTELTFS